MNKKSFGVKIEIGNLELYKVSSLSGHDRKTFKYGFMSRSVIKLQVCSIERVQKLMLNSTDILVPVPSAVTLYMTTRSKFGIRYSYFLWQNAARDRLCSNHKFVFSLVFPKCV